MALRKIFWVMHQSQMVTARTQRLEDTVPPPVHIRKKSGIVRGSHHHLISDEREKRTEGKTNGQSAQEVDMEQPVLGWPLGAYAQTVQMQPLSP